MQLSSSAFAHNGSVPPQYTCDGMQVSPPLSWTGVPAEAKSLALIMDDPDIPQQFKQSRGIEAFDHWVLFNIPPRVTEIPESGSVGTVGNNSAGKAAYAGPCPPPQYEPREHRYLFVLYALDTDLSLKAGASKKEVQDAMEGHIIAQAELVGRYQREA